MTGIPAQPTEQRYLTKAGFRALPESPPDFEFEDGVLISIPRAWSKKNTMPKQVATSARLLRKRIRYFGQPPFLIWRA